MRLEWKNKNAHGLVGYGYTEDGKHVATVAKLVGPGWAWSTWSDRQPLGRGEEGRLEAAKSAAEVDLATRLGVVG